MIDYHDCTYLKVFLMVVPKTITRFKSVDIFTNLETFGLWRLPTPAAWQVLKTHVYSTNLDKKVYVVDNIVWDTLKSLNMQPHMQREDVNCQQISAIVCKMFAGIVTNSGT